MSTTKRPTGRSTKKKAEAAAPKARAPKRAPTKPVHDERVKVSAPAKKARVTKKAAAPAAPIAPPRREFDLDGPIPAEGAGFSKKVGALLGVGQKALGIKSFRAGQAQAFDYLLDNQDVLAVMPTGSGKSLL